MTAYNVIGCLGVTVGSVSTIDEATALVLKQLPLSVKGTANLSRRLANCKPGRKVEIDYGHSGCTVFVM